MIEIDGVSHRFGERAVLKELSLRLTERRIALVGDNGSGKSTFARLLNGLLIPERGTVRIDGLDTRKEVKAVRRRVGFVFQNPDNQIVYPVVEEDIAFGLKNLKLGKAEIARKVDEVLDRYGLTEFRNHPAHQLSAGQKQLLAISSVLVMAPRYVVFDEPTTSLDRRNKRMITQVIGALDQTVILISHDLDLLRDFDRVIVFDQGRIAADGRPDTALDAYVALAP